MVKNPPASAELQGQTQVHSLAGEDSPGEDCQGNPIDGGAWQATVHGVTESDRTE